MVSNPLEQAAVEQAEETIGIERSDVLVGGRSGVRKDKAKMDLTKMEVVVLAIAGVMEVALAELAVTETIQVSMVCTSLKQWAFK